MQLSVLSKVVFQKVKIHFKTSNANFSYLARLYVNFEHALGFYVKKSSNLLTPDMNALKRIINKIDQI